MAVTQFNPEKLFEKMENNFVQALEKVCNQQAAMFASYCLLQGLSSFVLFSITCLANVVSQSGV
jgi:hypothetical protein